MKQIIFIERIKIISGVKKEQIVIWVSENMIKNGVWGRKRIRP